MEIPKIHEGEYRFCLIMWEHEPIAAAQLVKLCQEQLGWKRTTTYTVIKRLGERGVLKNEDGIVTALISKDEAQACEIDELVEKKFEGSLPAFIAATPSFFCWIGMIIVCTGAILGGNTSPLSSPCTMMIAPMIRVDIPHEVSYTGESLFSLFVYSIPKAFANPLPKLWLVPDCNALQSCINASIV